MRKSPLFVTLLVCLLGYQMMPGRASSHREAPLISNDPQADNTDVYAFVSPDAPDTVTLIASYIPFEDPAGGPNFYRFGDNVLYEFKIDNNGDGVEDITYQFRLHDADAERQHVPLQHRPDQGARRSQPQRLSDLHADAHRERPHGVSRPARC